MPTFTVFTGTYNSSSIIHRVFSSIDAQTYRDFEWIVIDDCSKDNTVRMVEDFSQKRPDLSVQIVRHIKNTGVATSRKEALQMAKCKYFVTWDHDDEQDAHQLEIYLQLWTKYDAPDIANIFAKMVDQHGHVLGIPFPKDPLLSNYIHLHNHYLRGNKGKGRIVEHHVCVKTAKYIEVLDYYDQHPELTDGRNPNGGDIWGMVAYLGYRTICTNAVVRKYYIMEPGRQSMSSASRKDGAWRIRSNKLLWVNYFDTKQPASEILSKTRNIFAVAMYNYLANQSFAKGVSAIKQFWPRVVFAILYLPAVMVGKRFSK